MSSLPQAQIQVKFEENVCYITMEGDADVDFVNVFSSTAQKLELSSEKTMLVMNMQHIDYMDSATISVFVKLVKLYQRQDRRIIVYRPKPYIEKLFEITGLAMLIQVCQTQTQLNQALGKIKKPKKKKAAKKVLPKKSKKKK
ncbi:MAG: hypothetical protein A2268_12185 [Candidatus Raymondbacteria bacterium RifOxyA12_full_50_37]|uniref:Anti-sigma factor antagonist n=1 Tax=Candidatus Raymondbacteria bacterium RIFOXYD12_FULL_49_13 TaxID=1817890 RepID=A0A1F7F318_UNCRA|nr:MAG: hypothetical protein A2268_12185 [Candidatus Raymondbacteria bacterium RifOxyA12_full_50_37]OGJ90303.1 MAG: hypothetical protein A2248_00070 [Candidatus Raymondbacteria bacterium RIFOXYA2_FULL_49_16]OGJ94629.1 MAG: hypothetical protein A2350_19255 [Candidatus Raymondbacteria bacterium RifOxyB12_full_50_8]OGJ97293.1 MAG: hypothetical protein A2453_01530 [Candidatus Raymondbacteria bacterium RIFOXYC2_FULL_50_21]OGK00906.1 MAG: hypothetical protein A2519_12700 [Candidatus Raymondbacteria b